MFVAAVARRPYHLGLAAFVLGLLLCGAPFELSLLLAAGAALLIARRSPLLGLVVAVAVVGGALVGGLRVSSIDRAGVGLRFGTGLAGKVVLLEHPRASRFGSSAAVRVVSGPGRGNRLLARAPRRVRWPAGGEPGALLLVRGLVERPLRKPGEQFDYPAFLRRRGIGGELRLEWVRGTGAWRGGVAGLVDGARRRAEPLVARGLGEEEAALVRGMVLGEDERISPETRDDFRRSGLAHLLRYLTMAITDPPRARMSGFMDLGS